MTGMDRRTALALWLREARAVPVLFFILLPVLAVRLKYVMVSTDAAHLWDAFYVGDVRSWWKAVFVVGTAGWMVAHACVFLIGGWRPVHRLLFAFIVFAALSTVGSALLSEYPVTSWFGYTGQYEGTVTLLAYLFGMWYTAELIDEPLWIYRCIGAAGLINSVMGIAKGMGWDFWLSGAGYWVIGAESNRVRNIFADSRLASGTIFQPNHFGMFMVMVVMLSVGMLFVEKGRRWLVFWLVSCLAACLAVVFSHSRAAVLVCIFTLGVFFVGTVIKRRRGAGPVTAQEKPLLWRKRTPLILFTVFLAITTIGFIAFSDVRMAVSQMLGRSMPVSEKRNSGLASLELSDSQIRLNMGDSTLLLRKDGGAQWNAYSQDGRSIQKLDWTAMTQDSGWSRLSLSMFPSLVFMHRADGRVQVRYEDVRLDFVDIGGEIFAMDTRNRLLKSVPPMRSIELWDMGHLFTGRGYIWSRALALVSDHLFFGSGPGTFALVFPTTELVGKQRYLGNSNEDKGHGIWIHFLVQLGVIGWLAYAAIVVYIAYTAWHGYRLAVLPAILGASAYLTASVTNDSTVGVTPVFCVLCGIIAGKGRADSFLE